MTEPIVGYVNDGTDDIMISHAWIELDGRKIDVTLSVVDPNTSMSGGLVILDTEIVPGQASYSYHHQMNAGGGGARMSHRERTGEPVRYSLIVSIRAAQGTELFAEVESSIASEIAIGI